MGYGSAGNAHAHAWLNMPLYFYPPPAKPILEAIYGGRNRERVELFAKKYGFKRIIADWKELVKDPDIDVVVIGTPAITHTEAAVTALESGKHVLCEKPMARNAEEAKAMVKAAAKSKSKNIVGFNYRFVPAIAYAKKLIEQGYIGKISNFRGSYLNSMPDFAYLDLSIPVLGADWHFTPGAGGYGAITDIGTHILDMARFLVGEVTSVASARSQIAEERLLADRPNEKGKVSSNIEDLAVAALKFRGGALGTVEASWMAPGGKDLMRFDIYGTEGAIRFNLERIHELEVFTLKDSKEMRGFKNILTLSSSHPLMDKYWLDQGGGFAWEYTFVNELHHFADCIVNDKSVSPQGATFLDGYRNCVIMDAMVQSAKDERWVAVSPDNP